jgi:hypothetical protein
LCPLHTSCTCSIKQNHPHISCQPYVHLPADNGPIEEESEAYAFVALAVQQQPLLFAQGLEAAFRGAAGTQLLHAAAIAAQLLQATVATAARLLLHANREPPTGTSAQAGAALLTALSHSTAAFSMLLTGLRMVNKAAAGIPSSAVRNRASLDQLDHAMESLSLAQEVVDVVAKQQDTICANLAPLLRLSDELDEMESTDELNLLLFFAGQATLLEATAMHTFATMLLQWQAAAAAAGSAAAAAASTWHLMYGVVEGVELMLEIAAPALSSAIGTVSLHVKGVQAVMDLWSPESDASGTESDPLQQLKQHYPARHAAELKQQLQQQLPRRITAAAPAIAAAANPYAALAAGAAAYGRQLLLDLQQYAATAAATAAMPSGEPGRSCSNISCSNTGLAVTYLTCSACDAAFYCSRECEVSLHDVVKIVNVVELCSEATCSMYVAVAWSCSVSLT